MEQNLEHWGYEKTNKKPSLIIFYSLHYDNMEMKGYTQPNFEQWVRENFSNKVVGQTADAGVSSDSTFSSFNPYSENGSVVKTVNRYDPVLCELKEGTLLISFYDRKKKKTVWQGYASGIFGNDRFDNNRFVRHIVHRIMDKYRILSRNSLTSRRIHRSGMSIMLI